MIDKERVSLSRIWQRIVLPIGADERLGVAIRVRVSDSCRVNL